MSYRHTNKYVLRKKRRINRDKPLVRYWRQSILMVNWYLFQINDQLWLRMM